MLKNLGHLALNLLSTILLFTPFAPLGALLAGINAAWYFYDGDILGGLCSLGIVLGGVGSLIGGTAGLIMSGCGNLLLAGTSTWSAGQSIGKMYMDYQETGTINPWDAVSATMNLGMAVMGGYGAFKSFSSIPAMGRIKEAEISARAARNTNPETGRGPEGTGGKSEVPKLPEFDGKTTVGAINTSNGETVYFESGNPDPRYNNYPAAAHVEGKAALYMRENGIMEGTIYHNNTNGTCGYCDNMLETLLPENAELFVIPPENAVANNSRAVANPSLYIGNSNIPKINPRYINSIDQ